MKYLLILLILFFSGCSSKELRETGEMSAKTNEIGYVFGGILVFISNLTAEEKQK